MNIFEAIKSGKPFKRPHFDRWYDYLHEVFDLVERIAIVSIDNSYRLLAPIDILSEDWEIKKNPPFSVTIKTICNHCKEEYSTGIEDYGYKDLEPAKATGGNIFKCKCDRHYKTNFEIREVKE